MFLFCLARAFCPLPNARGQARRTAGARHERTLFAVACTPLLAGVGLGCLEHPNLLADADRAVPLNDGFDMALELR